MLRKALVMSAFISLVFISMAVAEEALVNEVSGEAAVVDGAVIDDAKPAPFMVRNNKCPVCGMTMSENTLGQNTIEYQNKIYNICSVGDRDIFLTDPDKYSRIADDEMANASDVVNATSVEKPAAPTM